MNISVLLLIGIIASVQTTVSGTDAEIIFIRRVAPLLREKCVACHGAAADDGGAEKTEGGLKLTTLDDVRNGGDSGQSAVVSGLPESSPMYLAVMRTHDTWSAMPPKEADQLTDQQSEWIRRWIELGAAWPNAERIAEIEQANSAAWSAEDGVTVATSGGLSSDWTNRRYLPDGLWAYQPVPALSSFPQFSGDVHPVDRFIASRIPAGLSVAPAVDRITLIRRATFDLTGLPPAPEDVRRFAEDPQSDANAFAVVVNRLLESPHYGERMAQHWLDVVRYADSAGFANDYERGNAWRYRDYVVRSFNSDKAYDQFIHEQIAGDEIHPQNPELLIATGFLRMGPWELTGMEVARIARQRFLDDVTNSVGETFLAHSLQCARCHDHKFDPVPTRDYYSIQAVFATTQLAEREASFLPAENLAGFEEKKYLDQRRADYLGTLGQLDQQLLTAADAWFVAHRIDPATWSAAVEQARGRAGKNKRQEAGNVYSGARGILLNRGVAENQFPPKLYGFTPADYGNERVARKGLERLRWELDRYEPIALSVYSGRTPDLHNVSAPMRIPATPMKDGELEDSCIRTGGDPFASGEKVAPGILTVIAGGTPSRFGDEIEGRRRAFAEWVADAANPLTTRAIVNRVWLWHFGQAIAGNPNNFGSTGKRPTHPELLDWLAATFIRQGWSVKSLHRTIMMSDAYRRSCEHPDRGLLMQLDPDQISLAAFMPRRLAGEELRDAMLAASGELNPAIGGIPNRPEINPEAALQPRQVMGTFAAAWTPNPLPAQRHRRSLYALKLRGLRDPFLEVFNEPAPDFSCERRESSTVTPQVFSLFNSQSSYDRALALANRALRESGSDSETINRCFELTLSRRPSAEESASCLDHWVNAEARAGLLPSDIEQPLLEIQRVAVEENTGERFTFSERLYSNADFIADLKPRDVSPHCRALADVCLVLLNSNEFVYIY